MKATLATLAMAAALAACHEIPQDAPKPYAGKEDTKAYAGDQFKGDKQKYETTLAERAKYQNEYLRVEAKK
jgi:aminoglycoside phosphotransferase (APT) family kinase protein